VTKARPRAIDSHPVDYSIVFKNIALFIPTDRMSIDLYTALKKGYPAFILK